MKWYSSCISFDIHFEHFLLFRAIFIWQPVSINKLWDDNLILEIAFLNLKLFNLCKYSDIVKLTFNSLYKNNDEQKLILFSNYLYRSTCLVDVMIQAWIHLYLQILSTSKLQQNQQTQEYILLYMTNYHTLYHLHVSSDTS